MASPSGPGLFLRVVSPSIMSLSLPASLLVPGESLSIPAAQWPLTEEPSGQEMKGLIQ